MALFGLLGNKPEASTGLGLPKAPPGLAQSQPGLGGLTAQLPPAPPPTKKASIWDDEHRKDTMLAISAGILQGNNFAEGMGGVAQNLLHQRQALRQEGRSQIGGPDDAFEIFTDPQTGERTYKPIPEFADYNAKKRVKPKDVADMNGRAMYAVSQLPPAEQAAAYAEIRANPDFYGVDIDTLPAQWSPAYGSIVGNMGMTVSQAMTRGQAATNEGNREVHRTAADKDRTERTGIYRDRAAAATSQAAERIGIAREALAKRGAGGGGSSGKKAGKSPISAMSTSELLSIALGN